MKVTTRLPPSIQILSSVWTSASPFFLVFYTEFSETADHDIFPAFKDFFHNVQIESVFAIIDFTLKTTLDFHVPILVYVKKASEQFGQGWAAFNLVVIKNMESSLPRWLLELSPLLFRR